MAEPQHTRLRSVMVPTAPGVSASPALSGLLFLLPHGRRTGLAFGHTTPGGFLLIMGANCTLLGPRSPGFPGFLFLAFSATCAGLAASPARGPPDGDPGAGEQGGDAHPCEDLPQLLNIHGFPPQIMNDLPPERASPPPIEVRIPGLEGARHGVKPYFAVGVLLQNHPTRPLEPVQDRLPFHDFQIPPSGSGIPGSRAVLCKSARHAPAALRHRPTIAETTGRGTIAHPGLPGESRRQTRASWYPPCLRALGRPLDHLARSSKRFHRL